MIRQMIKIDKDLCNGCGLCISACHEGAIALRDGKAEVTRDDYCDGLGNCLPVCPTGAITFETRKALPFDEEAVKKNMARMAAEKAAEKASEKASEKEKSEEAEKEAAPAHFSGCPGSRAMAFARQDKPAAPAAAAMPAAAPESQLRQWPVQIQLVPVNAPYFRDAKLLIAADCAAFSHGNFHQAFMQGKVTLIGCPKLDDVDYSEKLTAILKTNDIKSLTIVRMEVPCCGGLEYAAKKALQDCGKMIPWQVVTLSTQGEILD